MKRQSKEEPPGTVQALKGAPMPVKLVDREKRLSSITEVSKETFYSKNPHGSSSTD